MVLKERQTRSSRTKQREEEERALNALREKDQRRKEAIAARREARKRRRRNILLSALILTAIVVLIVIGYFAAQQQKQDLAHEATLLSNTQQHFTTTTETMEPRIDGSYYTKYEDPQYIRGDIFRYSTLGPTGEVETKELSSRIENGKNGLGGSFTRPVLISVHVIGEEDTNQTPRVEYKVCSLKAIDPDKPSYTGDPYAGKRERLPKPLVELPGGVPSNPWPLSDLDVLHSPCVDTATLYVPRGTIQPEPEPLAQPEE